MEMTDDRECDHWIEKEQRFGDSFLAKKIPGLLLGGILEYDADRNCVNEINDYRIHGFPVAEPPESRKLDFFTSHTWFPASCYKIYHSRRDTAQLKCSS